MLNASTSEIESYTLPIACTAEALRIGKYTLHDGGHQMTYVKRKTFRRRVI